jgi:hypothetical protein
VGPAAGLVVGSPRDETVSAVAMDRFVSCDWPEGDAAGS